MRFLCFWIVQLALCSPVYASETETQLPQCTLGPASPMDTKDAKKLTDYQVKIINGSEGPTVVESFVASGMKIVKSYHSCGDVTHNVRLHYENKKRTIAPLVKYFSGREAILDFGKSRSDVMKKLKLADRSTKKLKSLEDNPICVSEGWDGGDPVCWSDITVKVFDDGAELKYSQHP